MLNKHQPINQWLSVKSTIDYRAK